MEHAGGSRPPGVSSDDGARTERGLAGGRVTRMPRPTDGFAPIRWRALLESADPESATETAVSPDESHPPDAMGLPGDRAPHTAPDDTGADADLVTAVAQPAEDEVAPARRRRTALLTAAAALLAVEVAAVVLAAYLRSDGEPDARAAAAALPDVPADAAPVESSQPASITTSPAVYTEDFDLLPVAALVEGWTATASERLEVAAEPTAVDRSALLASRDRGTVCRELDVPLGTLTATFMVDALPGGALPILSAELDDGTQLDLTLTDSGALVSDEATPVEIAADTWYRWVVALDAQGVASALESADETLLAAAVTASDGTDATRFCMTTTAPTRLYLDELSLEAG